MRSEHTVPVHVAAKRIELCREVPALAHDLGKERRRGAVRGATGLARKLLREREDAAPGVVDGGGIGPVLRVKALQELDARRLEAHRHPLTCRTARRCRSKPRALAQTACNRPPSM